MSFFILDHRPVRIKVKQTPLGKGGEGQIHEVIEPPRFRQSVVKIYHPQERDSQQAAKLQYLIQNPPADLSEGSLIWPQYLVYDEANRFVGYLMSKAKFSENLSALSSLGFPKRLSQSWKIHYDRKNLQGLWHLSQVCLQIAKAVQKLHQDGRYRLVDLKPENILVNLKGEVSLIDLDSVEVFSGKKVRFQARKLSNEYCPSERINLSYHHAGFSSHWSHFSLAVIFYKILTGIHPFAATGDNHYEKLHSHQEKIQAGLFVHGQKAQHLSVIPHPHVNFWSLPAAVRELFFLALDEGGAHPEKRPDAQAWQTVLEALSPRDFQPLPLSSSKTASSSPRLQRTHKQRPPTLWVHGLMLSLLGLGLMSILSSSPPAAEIQRESASMTPALTTSATEGKTFAQRGTFSEGKAWVELENRFGFIDENLQISVPLIYDRAWNYEFGLAKVQKGAYYGYIDHQGREVLPIIYTQIEKIYWQEKLFFLIFKSHQWQILNQAQNLAGNTKWLNDYLIQIQIDGKIGLINHFGKIICLPRYDELVLDVNGGAKVAIQNKWGYIDDKGRELIAPKYDQLGEFTFGIARAKYHQKTYYINHRGFCVKDCPSGE